MIINGDVASQVAAAPEGSQVKGFEPYEDEKGRLRHRFIWA